VLYFTPPASVRDYQYSPNRALLAELQEEVAASGKCLRKLSVNYTSVTASWVVAGIDRVTILSLYQSAVCNKTKYRRLRPSCCNKPLTISQLPSSS